MIFEIFISIIIIYLYISIHILKFNYNNIDINHNVLYKNISKYIKDIQDIYKQINYNNITNDEKLRKINIILNTTIDDINYMKKIINQNSYEINIIKDDNTHLYNDYIKHYQKKL